MGEQLFALSWDIDRTNMNEVGILKSKSYSNSQVLPCEYKLKEGIEIVIREWLTKWLPGLEHTRNKLIKSIYLLVIPLQKVNTSGVTVLESNKGLIPMIQVN